MFANKFKNDKEHIAFLDDYRNIDNGWRLWKEDPDIGRRWWRNDLLDSSLIVEEEQRKYKWPDTHITWTVVHWFIVTGGADVFSEYVASRTLALAHLKEVMKAWG